MSKKVYKRNYPYINENDNYPKFEKKFKEGKDETNLIKESENEKELVNIKDNDVEYKQNDKNKNELLPLDIVNEIKIEKDGNCFYRTISQAYFGTQNYHEQIRRQIYEYAFENKENFTNFILSDEGLTTEQYIEKIKLDKRFAGDLEISICSVLYQINIYVYSYRKDGYKLYYVYESQDSNENIYIGFINMNHFYLLNVGNNQDNQMNINSNEVNTDKKINQDKHLPKISKSRKIIQKRIKGIKSLVEN